MHEHTTECWNSYVIWDSFNNSKYLNPWNKAEALVLIKKQDTFVIFRLV